MTATPQFYTANDPIPELGVQAGYHITIQGARAVVFWEIPADRLTPHLAHLREVKATK
jgi:hypothetical protein